jgi:hypothetical protein
MCLAELDMERHLTVIIIIIIIIITVRGQEKVIWGSKYTPGLQRL